MRSMTVAVKCSQCGKHLRGHLTTTGYQVLKHKRADDSTPCRGWLYNDHRTVDETGTKSYRTWCERLESGRLTKSECQQFQHAIVRRHMGLMPRGRHINITFEECDDLVDRIRANPVSLTPEHTAQGLAWLRDRGVKALDMPPETVTAFSHFSWDGTVNLDGYDQDYTVWTVHLTDGRSLRYWNATWQDRGYSGTLPDAWAWA